MRRITIIIAVLLASSALAEGPGALMQSPSVVGGVTVQSFPARNAALYGLGSSIAQGCYASGSTALAVDGAGAPVAMTFARNSTKYYPDTPAAWWTSCPANQLAVWGTGAGAKLDAPGTNLLGAPTDSPSGGAPWVLVAAGPTVTQNSADITFLDGTQTTSKFIEAAGGVSGLYQTITATANQYCASMIFQWSSRQCWGFSFDGVTADAKWDIRQGKVLYCPTYPDCSSTSATVKVGAINLGRGFIEGWACKTLAAGNTNMTWFATSTCSDNVIADTAATAISYLTRAQVETRVAFSNAQVSTYTPAGTVRPIETLTFPVTLADGNVCLGAKLEPYPGWWTTHVTEPMSLYGGTVTLGAANSMYIEMAPTYVSVSVYDNAAALKSVITNINESYAANKPRIVMGCTTAAGAMSLVVDGVIATNTSGAGTGILTTPPTTLYVGSRSGSGASFVSESMSVSDLIVCNTGDPTQCGDTVVQARYTNLAVGDSITAAVVGNPPWTTTASTISGAHIAQISRPGYNTADCLASYQANRGHRYRKVAVFCGTNDSGVTWWDNMRALYAEIRSDGAIPIPMTIMPKGAVGQTEIDRKNMNRTILAWCSANGVACADIATEMDDPGNPGHLRAVDDSGDGLHPSVTGQGHIGTFMAPFFR